MRNITKITSYVQGCLLKCLIDYLLSYCLNCLANVIFNLRIEWVTSPFRSSVIPLQEALKPAPSIPCYNTLVNAMKQLLYYQETL